MCVADFFFIFIFFYYYQGVIVSASQNNSTPWCQLQLFLPCKIYELFSRARIDLVMELQHSHKDIFNRCNVVRFPCDTKRAVSWLIRKCTGDTGLLGHWAKGKSPARLRIYSKSLLGTPTNMLIKAGWNSFKQMRTLVGEFGILPWGGSQSSTYLTL